MYLSRNNSTILGNKVILGFCYQGNRLPILNILFQENLAKLQLKSQGQFTKQYRDRAKERRLKEGNSGRAQGFLQRV